MGTTLAHTHAILMPTRAVSNVGMDLAYAKLVPTSDWHTCCYPCKTRANSGRYHKSPQDATYAKPMPTLGASRVGTNVATCKSCAKCWTGGRVDSC